MQKGLCSLERRLGNRTGLYKRLRAWALRTIRWGNAFDGCARRSCSTKPDRNLLDRKTGNFTKEVKTQFEFTRTTSLPTAGIIVKGCLDDCDVCEPEVQRKIQLELDRLELQNQLLKRQIELLDKSQEYRCCPAGEVETPA